MDIAASIPRTKAASRPLCVVLLLLSLLSEPALAVPVDNLYEVEVPVADESRRELEKGARAGLLQVLIKVSGSLEVDASGLVREALGRPADYYYQYGYESAGRKVAEGDEDPGKRVKMFFDPGAVAGLLREAGLPVWGANRPGVLLWIATMKGTERSLLRGDEGTELVEGLRDQAGKRGVPLSFPLMDLEDSSRVSVGEVWGAFLDPVEAASTRYGPDVILTARIRQETTGEWTGIWFYRVSGEWYPVENRASSEKELAYDMINLLADELAREYALGSSRGEVTLQVEGIDNLGQYAAMSGYLEALTPVTRSSVVSLGPNRVVFELQTEGRYGQLVRIIELDERMLLLERDERGTRLSYRWVE